MLDSFPASFRTLDTGLAAIALLALATMAGLAVPTAAEPLRDPVRIDAGYVAGTIIGEPGETARIYRGVPYAAPPVGDLRWRPPQPVEPWDGILEATSFSKMAPQSYPASPVYDGVPESGMSEDALYLNVITPAEDTDESLPVMVWFHGGGLSSGWSNGAGVNSAELPQEDVIVVTVNHRIGPIGYMAHPALTEESEQDSSGNYGSLDTVAALEWVQRNIEGFGGDPDRVTIFGVSGGGQKTLWLLASPLAEGLFHRAIVMSGGIGGTPLEETEQYGQSVAEELGVSDADDVAAAMRERPWQDIIDAAGSAGDYSSEFTLDNWSLDDVAAHSDVPLIVGFMGAEKSPETSPAFIERAITPAIEPLSTVYAYTFTHIPYNWGSNGALAYHGGDVSYAFGVPEQLEGHYGTLFRPDEELDVPRDPGLDERDEWVARAMTKMWARFAATGDPTLSEEEYEELDRSWTWPTLDEDDQYLDIGVNPIVKTGWVHGGEDQQQPRY